MSVDEALAAVDRLAVVHADNDEPLAAVFLDHRLHVRHFLAAGTAPGRPEVEENGLAAEVGEAHAVAVEGGELEVGRKVTFVRPNVAPFEGGRVDIGCGGEDIGDAVAGFRSVASSSGNNTPACQRASTATATMAPAATRRMRGLFASTSGARG